MEAAKNGAVYMKRLEEVKMFQTLDTRTIQKMWEMGKVVSYKKNITCFNAKDANNYIYILLEGKVDVYSLTQGGRKKTIFFLGEGELINDSILPESKMEIYCRTMVPCEIFMIRSKAMEQLMTENFEVARILIKQLERKTWRMSHQLKNTMGSIYMERKLAAKLWKLSRDFGKTDENGLYIDLPLSVTDLADFLGAPRETTSRICKALCNYKLIEIKHRKIYIISPDYLSYFYKKGIVCPENK